MRRQVLSSHVRHRRSRAWASRRTGASRRCSAAASASSARVGFFAALMTTLLRSRGAFLRPGFCIVASLTPNRGVGGAPRNVRVQRHPWGVSCASKTRVNALMTRYARRLRGALRPITRDARLSALHRGGFGLPGPRFRVPASRGERLRAACRRTPLPAPPSGSSPETPLMSEDGKSCSMASRRSQQKYTICSQRK